MKSYYVYLMSNWNNHVLYTGVTNNLLLRVQQHKSKLIDGFTSNYNVNKLVYFENFNYIYEAIAAEKKIKGWKRIKKNKLVETLNPKWDDLALKLEFYSKTFIS